MIVGAWTATLVLSGCDGGQAPTNASHQAPIRFGIISTESSAGLKTGFDPFLADMAASMGQPVEGYFASDYAGIIEGMRFGKVDLAWMGNKSAVEAVDRAGAEVFAQTMAADGAPGYWSVIIVNADGPLRTLDDILTRKSELTFGNGDPNSTSGYLLPNYYLWSKQGIDPVRDFKRVLNTNHESNAMAVAGGQIDLATNNTETLGLLQQKKPEIAAKLRVVWKSPLIPLDPLVWRKDLPEQTKEKLRKFLFTYGTGEGEQAQRQRQVLAKMSSGWAPFRPSSNDQLLGTREIALATRLLKLQQEANAPSAEKAGEIAQVKQELERIRSRREAIETASSQQTSETVAAPSAARSVTP